MVHEKVREVGIVVKQDSTDALEECCNLINLLNFKDIKYTVNKPASENFDVEGAPISEMSKNDIVVIIGGDGTILRTIHKLSKPVPIIGINIGEVGFLANLERDNFPENFKSILNGFDIESRMKIALSLPEGLKKSPSAMNEVVLMTSEPAKMLQLKITLDDREIEKFRADGIIIATPTGSTAYSMSAGGPIVDPNVEGFLIVPLAPYKLSARPIVVPSSSTISVELIRKGKKAKLVIDGQMVETVEEGDTVEFYKSSDPTLFVKTEESDFYSKIKEKLT